MEILEQYMKFVQKKTLERRHLHSGVGVFMTNFEQIHALFGCFYY